MTFTCSSAGVEVHVLELERLLVQHRAPCPRPRTPRPRRRRSARRRAAPRRRPSGTPRGSGRRTTPSRSSASRHMSSPSSRKSATRPAFSSDWFSSAPDPGTRDVLPELVAQRRDLAERLAQARVVARHAAVVPHDLAELAVERVDGALALDRRAASRRARSTSARRSLNARMIGRRPAPSFGCAR